MTKEIADIAAGSATLSAEILATYDCLRKKIALFYQFPPEAFSLQDLNRILQNYNAFDVQIILGPVLRSVAAHFMHSDEEAVGFFRLADDDFAESENALFINHKTQLQENGRYASLSPDELSVFLASRFKFRLSYRQEGQFRRLPEEDVDQQFANRPMMDLYHEGGIEGAGSGGHWERTATQEDRTYLEQSEDTKLHIFTALLGNEHRLTQFGLELLKRHIHLTHSQGSAEDFIILQLTVAQIEKFIYNREYVAVDCAKRLLGKLTGDAEYVIDSLLVIDREYDRQFRRLIDNNLPEHTQYAPPEKAGQYSTLDYQIALTLLTPPVPQSLAASRDGAEQRPVWHLRANEISLLDIEYILFNQGLSEQLYALCNRDDIAPLLSQEFLNMLQEDENFETKSSQVLKDRVGLSVPVVANSNPQTQPMPPIVFRLEDSSEERLSNSSNRQPSSQSVVSPSAQPPVSADFYLSCMKYFFIASGAFAVLAALTCTPVPALLGIAGATATKIAVTSALFSVTTFLTGLSIFALRRSTDSKLEAQSQASQKSFKQ